MEPLQVGAAASAIAAADFSFWTFTRADFIVKSVIIMLIAHQSIHGH